MPNDHAQQQRRAWLQTLRRGRVAPNRRRLVERLLGALSPSRRRTRALLRQVLVRV